MKKNEFEVKFWIKGYKKPSIVWTMKTERLLEYDPVKFKQNFINAVIWYERRKNVNPKNPMHKMWK